MKFNSHFLIFAFCFFAVQIFGQQEQQYTQFMFNKMAWNPGYAGSYVSPVLSAVYRGQWLGLEGAPSTQVISYHQPAMNGRVGIGGNLSRHAVGINQALNFDVAYAYRINMRQGKLAVGLQASLRNFRQNWSDKRLVGSQDINTDGAIPAEPTSKLVPNFGFGLFYKNDKYFCGLSIPRLVANNIDFATSGSVLSREVPHVFLSGGMVFEPSEDLSITPQILIKYVKGAPLDADLNCNALFNKRFLAGLTYRTGAGEVSSLGESLDVLFGIQATEKFYFGLSYDIGLTRLRKYSAGSLEALVRCYLFPPDGVVDYDRPNDF